MVGRAHPTILAISNEWDLRFQIFELDQDFCNR
jgi:hypothetical protein